MKPGDRVKLEIPKSKTLEKLEKEGVAGSVKHMGSGFG
jgi:hypothetical protein